jgi:hypothetical protein
VVGLEFASWYASMMIKKLIEVGKNEGAIENTCVENYWS